MLEIVGAAPFRDPYGLPRRAGGYVSADIRPTARGYARAGRSSQEATSPLAPLLSATCGPIATWVQSNIILNQRPMLLKNRKYLERFYDSWDRHPVGSRNIIIVAGRQVEKCAHEDSVIPLANGDGRLLKDIQVGDSIVGLAQDTSRVGVGVVTWKSKRLSKPCVRIKTRQGHETLVATTHRMRTWEAWNEAQDLQVGDRLAVVRHAGDFDNVDVPTTSALHKLTVEWDMSGSESGDKRAPPFVWKLGRGHTALFLNRLWAGDGHISVQGSSYHIEYDTISLRLGRDVQRLLWKFGIPSSFRRWKPQVYRDTDRWAYKLRIETQEGMLLFLREIGSLAKTESMREPDTDSDNNRDTYPIEVNESIRKIYADGLGKKKGTRQAKETLYIDGLRLTLKYPLTKEKLQQCVDYFRADARFDAAAVSRLARHLTTDLFWDEITEIEDLGEQPCYDLTVDATNSFITDGFITHNTTSLVAKAVALGIMNKAFDTLFIEPRFEQVRVLSQQRFAPLCEDSPEVKAHIDSSCVWQVGARAFDTRSFYNFRSCFYSADAIRGITANHLVLDEIQDIISDNIPVLEFCQSHFPRDELQRYNTYAGTPKTTSNTLSLLYNESNQMEWMVKCEACNHYNYMDEKIIGLKGYICAKCGRPIDTVRNGIWVIMRPSKNDDRWGMRISQLMVPFMAHSDIVKLRDDPNTPRRIFFNECLGLAYDAGQLVLTREDVLVCCEDRKATTPATLGAYGALFIVAGVDHGTGEYSPSRMSTTRKKPASFTAMAFGGFDTEGVFKILRVVRFVGEAAELSQQPALINRLARQYNARWMMSDWGFGAQTNASLISKFGWTRMDTGYTPVLMECQYHGGTTPISWNPAAFRYMISRNWAIEKAVDAIKSRRIRFYRSEEMEEIMSDFTSMYNEFDFTYNRLRYDHTLPDDCFQAVIYCYLAALQQRGMLVPTVVPNLPEEWVDAGHPFEERHDLEEV